MFENELEVTSDFKKAKVIKPTEVVCEQSGG